MKKTSIAEQFAHTTIDVKTALSIISTVPNYALAGVESNVSGFSLLLLGFLEEFEAMLRDYLAGEGTVSEEIVRRFFLDETIRSFQDFDKPGADAMILFSLRHVHDQLIHEQLFELLPRFKRIQRYIQKKFSVEVPQQVHDYINSLTK